MATPDFHFKRFSVTQEGVTHPVGTDAVLLGSWVNVSHASRILDIGTGTGVIALMLAQRTETKPQIQVDAVEIHPASAHCAAENFKASPWAGRLCVREMPVQEFAQQAGAGQYDLIVSNPPFFLEKTRAPDETRRLARHAATLPPLELLQVARHLLAPGGRLAVVLPVKEGLRFCELSVPNGLYWTRIMEVHGRRGKPLERLLIEFEKSPYLFQRESLVIYDDGVQYSAAYQQLTKDFYL